MFSTVISVFGIRHSVHATCYAPVGCSHSDIHLIQYSELGNSVPCFYTCWCKAVYCLSVSLVHCDSPMNRLHCLLLTSEKSTGCDSQISTPIHLFLHVTASIRETALQCTRDLISTRSNCSDTTRC